MWKYIFDAEHVSEEPLRANIPLNFLEFSRSEEGQFRPFHDHSDECRIMFCTRGKGFLRIENVEHELSPGRLFLIKPGQLHSCGCRGSESMEFWGISLFAVPGERFSRMLIENPYQAADFSSYLNYVDGAFSFIYELAQLPYPGHEKTDFIRHHSCSLVLFAISMLHSHYLNSPVPVDLPMQDVLRWLMKHYQEENTLATLARQFAMSSSHLSRSFYTAFGVSPINYLIDYRLNIAKDLLIHTNISIHEIAEKVGYENAYHFTNLFTKRIGSPPQEFRQYCRSENALPEVKEFREADLEIQ